MNDEGLPSQTLEASYAECQRIARASSSSFFYSFLVLPRRQREAMFALYAFLRQTDDLGDCQQSTDSRRRALAAWRASLHKALAGTCDHALLPALVDTVQRWGIAHEHLEAVIDGVEMDLEPVRYNTMDDLAGYCHRVASAVGLACLPIWGCRSAAAETPARSCGLAFQLTNILRDLKEDADAGRVYLPDEDLQRFGYSADDLRRGVNDARFQRLLQFQIQRAERYYDAGSDLMGYLSTDVRRVFGSMLAVYRALLAEVKRAEGEVLLRRVQLSRWQKMRIASQWFVGVERAEPAVSAVTP